MSVARILSSNPIITEQVEFAELSEILNRLEKVTRQHTDGSVVEFGCYVGTTSLFIRRVLDSVGLPFDFFVYDSFSGLPEKTSADNSPAGEQFKAGELTASKKEFIQNFRKAGLKLPVIHKGWFSDLKQDQIPDKIVFAFLDGDYYDSIRISLKLIEHSLVSGAVVIIDDYQSESLPGARKAVDEWLKNKDYALVTAHSLAIVTIS